MRDQLGTALAQAAGVDFDAPLEAAAEARPEPRQKQQLAPHPRAKSEARTVARAGAGPRPKRAKPEPKPEPEKIKHRPQPGPRKHISALRAEEKRGEAQGARRRIEMGEIADRKGRTVTIERHVEAKKPINKPVKKPMKKADETGRAASARCGPQRSPGPAARPPRESRAHRGRARAAREAEADDFWAPIFMRIVAGRLKGRALQSPTAQDIRPTSDRLRETIFNILAHAYGDPVDGAAVIDLFAGTGAMGCEALSRGAKRALFVDDGTSARALIRANVEALGLGGATKIFRRDARKLGAAPAGEKFSLAFLDPPYGKGLAEPALCALRDGGWLTQDALVIVEEAADAVLDIPAGFTLLEKRAYGDTQVVILRAAHPLAP